MMKLSKYSLGIGDRFGRQGMAQLAAVEKARLLGVLITPVWNKSFREHSIIHTTPADARKAADGAVRALGWSNDYFVDADHVSLKTVDAFIESCDFFTLDVADFISKKAEDSAIAAFIAEHQSLMGRLVLPNVEEPLFISKEWLIEIAAKYLFAVQEAGRIYRHILSKKEKDSFIVEVSMDETEEPQKPEELVIILAAIAHEGIPAQTIAPKFSGRFNKGVDYMGDVAQFAQEFEQDLAVIQFAVRRFALPDNLKLSVHSGSDKFSLYSPIRSALEKFDAGLHLKTAGTTWLEELIGLAEAGGPGLEIAKQIYRAAFFRYDELAKPYATVIDIDQSKLPQPDEVVQWNGERYAQTLRHDSENSRYNLNFRQLLHVSYKVAAEMGDAYFDALKTFEKPIAKNVTENLFERHIKPLFINIT